MSTNPLLKGRWGSEHGQNDWPKCVRRVWSRRSRDLVPEPLWRAGVTMSPRRQRWSSHWPMGRCRQWLSGNCPDPQVPLQCFSWHLSPTSPVGRTIRKFSGHSSTVSLGLVGLPQIQKHLSPCHQGSWQLGYKCSKKSSKIMPLLGPWNDVI